MKKPPAPAAGLVLVLGGASIEPFNAPKKPSSLLLLVFRQKGIRQKNLRFSVLDPLSAKKITGRPAIQWAAIAAAREKMSNFSTCSIMEYIFNEARNYFAKDVQ